MLTGFVEIATGQMSALQEISKWQQEYFFSNYLWFKGWREWKNIFFWLLFEGLYRILHRFLL